MTSNIISAVRIESLPPTGPHAAGLAELQGDLDLLNEQLDIRDGWDMGRIDRDFLRTIESFLSSVNYLPIPLLTSQIDQVPLVNCSFRTDFDGQPQNEQPMDLGLYLPGNIQVSAVVYSFNEIPERGGWTGTSPITIQHLLDGVAGLLSDALEKTLAVFTDAGLIPSNDTMLTLTEAVGDADLIREEAQTHPEISSTDKQALATISDESLAQALRYVVGSPAGMRIERRLASTMENQAMTVINELMPEDISWASIAAVKTAIGKKVDLS